MKILIVGSGLSGAICAREFAAIGYQVELLEKRNVVGGNIRDQKVEDIHVHLYGPHIYHSNDEKTTKYLKQFTKFNNYRNKVLGDIDDQQVPIPFNYLGIDKFFPQKSQKLKDLLEKNFGKDKRISIFDLKKSGNADLQELGSFIYEKVFRNYTSKMWGEKPEQIFSDILNRVPVTLSYDDFYFRDKYEGIPTQGYSNLIENLLNHPNIDISLNVDASKLIQFSKNKVLFKNKVVDYPIIYCGPIDELLDYKYGELAYRSLNIEFETINAEYFQKIAVINYPNHETMTRITEYKHFLNDFNPHKTIISREYPGSYNRSSKLWNMPYYPMGTREAVDQYKLYLADLKNIQNFYLLGRLAEYKYLNMDQAAKNALELVEQIKRGI